MPTRQASGPDRANLWGPRAPELLPVVSSAWMALLHSPDPESWCRPLSPSGAGSHYPMFPSPSGGWITPRTQGRIIQMTRQPGLPTGLQPPGGTPERCGPDRGQARSEAQAPPQQCVSYRFWRPRGHAGSCSLPVSPADSQAEKQSSKIQNPKSWSLYLDFSSNSKLRVGERGARTQKL